MTSVVRMSGMEMGHVCLELAVRRSFALAVLACVMVACGQEELAIERGAILASATPEQSNISERGEDGVLFGGFPTPPPPSSPTPTATPYAGPQTVEAKLITPVFPTPRTIELFNSLIPQFLEEEKLHTEKHNEVSPDGMWTSIVKNTLINHDGEWFVQTRLEISSIEANTAHLIYEEVTRDVAVSRFPTIIKWPNQDSDLLYAFAGQGDGCAFIPSYENLTGFNLKTGEEENYLPEQLGDIDLSPSSKLMVFSNFYSYDEQAESFFLSILSLEDKSVQTLEVDVPGVSRLADFIWSPDSSKIIFSADRNECLDDSEMALFQVELPSLSVSMLRDFEARLLRPIEIREGGLVLQGEFNEEEESWGFSLWLMDFASGELVPIRE